MCESRTKSYWDYNECKCITKGVAPREITCSEDKMFPASSHDTFRLGFAVSPALNIFLYVSLGFCMFLAGFLTASTWYYKMQVKHLKKITFPRDFKTKEQKQQNLKTSVNETETGRKSLKNLDSNIGYMLAQPNNQLCSDNNNVYRT